MYSRVRLRSFPKRFWSFMSECNISDGKEKPKVLVIAGTTSVGKTELSVEVARRINGEIISADSVQVYKNMDVGSAKVSAEEQKGVPHHLLDVAEPTKIFNVGDYCNLAAKAIQDVFSRGRVPIVVGGSSFYISTLMAGPTGAPVSTPETRAMADTMVEEDGHCWEKSLARLEKLDPEYASTIAANDWLRLKRALEICTLSKRTVVSFKKVYDPKSNPYNFKCIFLSMPRELLFLRIDARCEKIIEAGLLQEVVSLVRRHGLVANSQAGKCLGYRQALEYLQRVWGFPSEDKGCPYSLQIPRDELCKTYLECLFDYKAKTRKFSRTQLVWFKNNQNFKWLNVAPRGGGRLPVASMAEAVTQWFHEDRPFPNEWDGNGLKVLTEEEKLSLKTYVTPEHEPDKARIDSILQQIEECLQSDT